MATSSARGGRRRWMLHEDMRSGVAAVEEESLADEQGDGTARRYSIDGSSVSFAVASRLLPQRLLALWGLLIAGMALIAGLTLLDVRSAEVCRSLGIAELPAASWSSALSLGGWLSNACLWFATLLCLLIYGLRRHRLDDYRGSYRRWIGAAAGCAVANVLLSTGLHHSVAESLTAKSGFTALPGNALWWLVPAAIVGSWVVVRIGLDMRPCRMGLFSLAVACGLYLTALMASFGSLPGTTGEFLTAPVALSAGHLWLMIALLAQIRFILLETSGQIALPRASDSESEREAYSAKEPQNASRKQSAVAADKASISLAGTQPKPEPSQPSKKSHVAAAKGPTEWVDGRNPCDSDLSDEDDRPLSKADRKRLRKEQARRRAA